MLSVCNVGMKHPTVDLYVIPVIPTTNLSPDPKKLISQINLILRKTKSAQIIAFFLSIFSIHSENFTFL